MFSFAIGATPAPFSRCDIQFRTEISMPSTQDSNNPAPRPWRRAALAAALLAGTTLGGFAIGHAALPQGESQQSAGQQSNSQIAPVNPSGAQVMPSTLPDFTALVTRVKPAVVSITTKLKANAAAEMEEEQGGMQQLPFPFN